MTRSRIACRAVFLDAGGVIVLPDRHLLAGALAEIGIDIDPDAVPSAHYRAVRHLDRAPSYPAALFPELGVAPRRTVEALAVWTRLDNRDTAGKVLWSEPTPSALETIAALRRRGLAVVIVTNSDGHAEENLAACGFAGVPVIDSEVVGAAKPDPRIFEAALALAGGRAGGGDRVGPGIRATEVVHVGDTPSTDIAGARAAGITPIHFDPLRACRARDHRHVATLAGIWQHLSGPGRS